MNKVTLVGNIVADPKPTITSTGKEIASFSVAVRDTRNPKETYFIPCTAWDPNSKYINAYVKKGDLVTIDGRLTRRSYTPMEGKTVYVTEVVVDSFQKLIGSRANPTPNGRFNDASTSSTHESTDLDNQPHDNLTKNQTTPTNLDTVFNISTYDNDEDNQDDDIDWDSEFN